MHVSPLPQRPLQWLHSEAERAYDKVYDLFYNLSGVYNGAKEVFSLPMPLHKVVRPITYIGIVDILFSPKRFICAKDALVAGCELGNIISSLSELMLAMKEKCSWAETGYYAYIPGQILFSVRTDSKFLQITSLASALLSTVDLIYGATTRTLCLFAVVSVANLAYFALGFTTA